MRALLIVGITLILLTGCGTGIHGYFDPPPEDYPTGTGNIAVTPWSRYSELATCPKGLTEQVVYRGKQHYHRCLEPVDTESRAERKLETNKMLQEAATLMREKLKETPDETR